MKKLDMVIEESLRLYPPAPGVGRITVKDTHLGNYFIPKDTRILIPMWVFHHDDKYFPDAKEFKPFERWGNEEKKTEYE